MQTTPALKDIGRIAHLLSASPLAKSAVWYQPVAEIHPAQLYALTKRFRDLNQADIVETAISIAQDEVQKAVARNEFGVPMMLKYTRPLRTYMTLGELNSGLAQLGPARCAATIFALETNLDATAVSMLTHRRLATMGELPKVAQQCLEDFPRNLHTPYVFWENRHGHSMPVFGLDMAVFDAFGLLWNELKFGYENLIMIDGAADREAINCFLNR